MNFRDFYQPGIPRFSFEVFPPKEGTGVPALFEALRDLAAFDPAFISCTYGAMGSTRDVTRDLVIRIKRDLGLTAAFHFTCVGANKAEIQQYVGYLKKEGIDLVVALRGDPPQGETQFTPPPDGFAYANELVSFLKGIDGFSIAVAGYPEGHYESPNLATDLANLKRKVDAGADIVITQLFFDNHLYFDFVDRARKAEITIPIVPGIMPILSTKQIERIARLGRVSIPKPLHKQLLHYQDDPAKIREIGIEHASEQCRELLSRKVPGIHFYILNKSYSTRRVIEGIRQPRFPQRPSE